VAGRGLSRVVPPRWARRHERIAVPMHALRFLAFLMLAWPPAAPVHARESLEQIVAAAPPGTTISVPTGVHVVHLRLDKPVTLVGEPGAVLDGGGEGDVVRIGAAQVAVRGLTIRHSGTDLTAMNAGIFVERQARDVTLEGNRIEESLFGVYLDGAANVRVAHNVIRGMRSLRVADRGDGIHLWNDTGCTIEDNDVADSRDGIYVYVSPHNTIARNVVHEVRYGIHYMYSQHNLLRDNVSRSNLAGYALMSSDHLKVIGNTAEDD
jgi:nitrous oxidase accessory protein